MKRVRVFPAVAVLAFCVGACVAWAEWRDVTKYPPVTPDKLEPLRGMGPATLSTLTTAQIHDILRYGRLHMLRGIEKSPAEDDAVYKDLGVDVVSHSGSHRGALAWNNRPKTVQQMIDLSKVDRVSIADTHKIGSIVLAYADYQRWNTQDQHAQWPQQREEWKYLVGDAPADDAAFLMRNAQGLIIAPRGGLHTMGDAKGANMAVTLCLNAPFTLARAKAGIAMDVANGCDGNYFDCGGFPANACYCDNCRAAFKDWLEKNFTAAQRQDIFGEADAAKIDPRASSPEKPGGDAFKAARPHVPPLQIAYTRFKVDSTAWFRREIKAYGRSLNPNFLMTSTCWGHDGRPGFFNSQFEKYVGDWGDDFLFWEPGVSSGAGGGTPDEATARKAAEADATKAGKKAPDDFRWGRRSFSPTYKYLYAMARGCPAVSKISPTKADGAARELATELTYAETYANLCSMRAGNSAPYAPEAIKKMHAFQDANPDFFIGSKPRTPVAVLVSYNQVMAGRKDASIPFIRFLMDMGLECQVILDDQVTPKGLEPFDCVVLPATDMLSEAQMAALEQYRQSRSLGAEDFHNPGRLVIFGPSGTRDEWDRDRPNGLQRLVGDLAKGEAGDKTLVSADRETAFIPLGVCKNFPDNMWYRRANDCNISEVRKAFDGTIGKDWPYIAEPTQTREIHLAEIAGAKGGIRILAHVVNYDAAKPAEPFQLDIRLVKGLLPTVATWITPDSAAPEEVKLAIRGRTAGTINYARVTVPATRLYGVLAIDAISFSENKQIQQ